MKYSLFFLLLIIYSIPNLHGQNYDYYGLSLRSVYLPMGLFKGEAYFNKNKEDRHIEFFNKSTNDTLTRIDLEKNNFTTKYIGIIDSLINQNEFQITLENKIKDSIFLFITQNDLKFFSRKEFDKYFTVDNNIILSVNKFEVDSSIEKNISVFDELLYTLNIKYHQENSNDTINKDVIFVGSDYLKTSNIKNWLIGFIVLKRMNLFNNQMMIAEEDISEYNLVEVIARYIITQEKRE